MISRYTLPAMREIWTDENRFRKWLQVELAACVAWNKLGKIPATDLRNIKRKAKFSIGRINTIEKEVDHDVVAFLTAVGERVGSSSRYIHLGLTSADIVDTALGLLLREAGQIILGGLNGLHRTLKKQAIKYKKTIMAGRTHGVHAEPTTLGFKFLVYAQQASQNITRMKRAVEGISVGKFSGAVGTYSNVPPQLEVLACKELMLEASPISTQVIQRDRHAEYITTLAVIAGCIEQIALEIRGLQKTEIAEVEEPFKKGQKGSSAMPHKRNPITCERICGLARLVRGYALTALENIALWHERDISHSSTERVIFPDATTLVDYMLVKMTQIIQDLTVYPKNMLRNLDGSGGLIFSQRVLLALVGKGMSRDGAYSIVQSAAMKARFSDTSFRVRIEGDSKVRKLLSTKEISGLFDIRYFLRNMPAVYHRMGVG